MWLSRFLLSTQRVRRIDCAIFADFRVPVYFGWLFEYSFCSIFGEISSTFSSNNWHQYGIFIFLFLSLLRSIYLLSVFTICLWLEGLFVSFFCRSSLLYFLIFYNGDVPWLVLWFLSLSLQVSTIVVCSSLLHIYFSTLWNFWIVIYYAPLNSFKWETFYFTRI